MPDLRQALLQFMDVMNLMSVAHVTMHASKNLPYKVRLLQLNLHTLSQATPVRRDVRGRRLRCLNMS